MTFLYQRMLTFMAERGGFEPPMGFKPIHDFQSCALDQLSHLSVGYSTIILKTDTKIKRKFVVL